MARLLWSHNQRGPFRTVSSPFLNDFFCELMTLRQIGSLLIRFVEGMKINWVRWLSYLFWVAEIWVWKLNMLTGFFETFLIFSRLDGDVSALWRVECPICLSEFVIDLHCRNYLFLWHVKTSKHFVVYQMIVQPDRSSSAQWAYKFHLHIIEPSKSL